MVGLHSPRVVRTGLDGGAHTLAVNGVADTDDHENHLQSLRMIVNTVFQRLIFFPRQTERDTPLPMPRIVLS